jgi:sarcosine reductase
MRLELNILNIRDVQFGENTTVLDGVLYVNRIELEDLLQQDKRFRKIEIEIAHPGEKCRILRVSDVIEPRAKIKGGEDFPGVLGTGTAGEGNTCVLRGLAVAMSDDSEGGDLSRDPSGEIIDMSGSGAEFSPYGKTHNVVVLSYPADGTTLNDYRIALKLAEVRAAAYLAKAGKALPPDQVEVYDLPPLVKMWEDIKTLPRVAYIFQIFSAQFRTLDNEPVLYGASVEKFVPTILHPNEVLDGAIVNPYRGMGIETYQIQNHPIIKELYRRHGKDLCFTGVILTVAHNNEAESERSANMAANLAKRVLGADGAILTKSGGGAPEVNLAQTADRCEKIGVKTALAIWEIAADGSPESCTLFNSPRIDALVSMGTPMVTVSLPAMERIIGRATDLPNAPSIGGQTERLARWIRGMVGQLGSSGLTTVRS